MLFCIFSIVMFMAGVVIGFVLPSNTLVGICLVGFCTAAWIGTTIWNATANRIEELEKELLRKKGQV